MTLWTLLVVLAPLVLITGLTVYVGTLLSLTAQELYQALSQSFAETDVSHTLDGSAPHTA